MAEQLKLEIVTPQHTVLETEASWVVVPGTEGELGILPEHVPLMTTLGSGVLQFDREGGVSRVAVHYGYAQVQSDTVTILAEMAEQADDIDVARARDAEQRARSELQELISKQNEEETRIKKCEAKLSRALVRQSASN
ncbi:MAG: F0F1 ATP synthase subunit epsilon [SAR324 cluster bacterium]|nr:F0F1 ATP synthase subunit epsilon [SAR324 cluster bacterium]